MRPFDPRLLRVLPQARAWVVGVGAVVAGQGLATIAQAFALAGVVVAVVGAVGGDGGDLAGALALLAGVLALRGLLAGLLEVVAGGAGVRVSTSLRAALVAHRLARPGAELREDRDALVLATSGVTAVEPYVARFLPALVAGVVVPITALVALLVVDPWSALVVLLTLPLLPLFAALIGKATADETAKRWTALSALSGHFLDVMRGLPTLVSYGRAAHQVGTVEEVSGRYRTATMRTLRLAFLSSAALELLSTLCVAIVAVTVGIRLAWGQLDLLTGMVAILLAPEAYWPIRRVGAEFHSAADGVAALDRALDELDGSGEPTSGETAPAASRGAADGATVVLDRVGYTYPGSDRPVLDGLDARLRPGLTVVTGPSGAGKSTLLEVVAGIRPATEGEVTAPAAHLVTQRPFLVPGSLAENLRLGTGGTGGSDAGDRAGTDALWRVLREVGLANVVAALPDGLETSVGDDGVGLSAGQRARLALARALLSDAPLVLLDEPTAHLDADASQDAHAAILRLARSRTVVAVTHRPELLEHADQRLAVPVAVPA